MASPAAEMAVSPMQLGQHTPLAIMSTPLVRSRGSGTVQLEDTPFRECNPLLLSSTILGYDSTSESADSEYGTPRNVLSRSNSANLSGESADDAGEDAVEHSVRRAYRLLFPQFAKSARLKHQRSAGAGSGSGASGSGGAGLDSTTSHEEEETEDGEEESDACSASSSIAASPEHGCSGPCSPSSNASSDRQRRRQRRRFTTSSHEIGAAGNRSSSSSSRSSRRSGSVSNNLASSPSRGRGIGRRRRKREDGIEPAGEASDLTGAAGAGELRTAAAPRLDLTGKYAFDSTASEDSDAFLKLCGQSWLVRRAARTAMVHVTIDQTWCEEHLCDTVKVSSLIKMLGKTVKWGQQLDGKETHYLEQDGSKVLSTSSWTTRPELHTGATRWVFRKSNIPGSKVPAFEAVEERWLENDGNTLVVARWLQKGSEEATFTAYFNRM